MKERPILFSTPMVRAILEGRKGQTRRIIKPQPETIKKVPYYAELEKHWGELSFTYPDGESKLVKPKYDIGDILWVRETFYALGKWEKNGTTKTGKQKYRFRDLTKKMGREYMYLVYSDKPDQVETKKDGLIHWYKRPAIFMPRIACRLKLNITDLRVERVQNISEKDAMAEGVVLQLPSHLWKNYRPGTEPKEGFSSPFSSYETLWRQINGGESWNANPWVWVICFERIK